MQKIYRDERPLDVHLGMLGNRDEHPPGVHSGMFATKLCIRFSYLCFNMTATRWQVPERIAFTQKTKEILSEIPLLSHPFISVKKKSRFLDSFSKHTIFCFIPYQAFSTALPDLAPHK
ncbi:hypothetical protein ABXS75_07295 [Roseburia hominis]